MQNHTPNIPYKLYHLYRCRECIIYPYNYDYWRDVKLHVCDAIIYNIEHNTVKDSVFYFIDIIDLFPYDGEIPSDFQQTIDEKNWSYYEFCRQTSRVTQHI